MNKRAFAWLFPLGAIAAVLSFPWPPPVLGVLIAVAVVAMLVAAGLYFAKSISFGAPRYLAALLIGLASGAMVVASLPLFVHLPRWLSFGMATMVAVIVVNAAIAIIIGLVYVKWGIESAMTSHFGGDIAVHVAGPYFFA